MLSRLSGNQIAIVNFVFWGLLPLYYQFVSVNDIFELFSFRILASLPFLALVFYAMKKPWPTWRVLFKQKCSFFMALLASLFISVSWCAYTYAVTHGQVLEASLGFFIAPLFAISFGVIIQGDKPSPLQQLAIAAAVTGVGYQIFFYQRLPMLSLLMASFFALYGLCKKYTDYDMIVSVTLETLLIAPLCLIYLVWIIADGQSQIMHGDIKTLLLFIGSAPLTIIPYLLYTLAVSRTSLTMIGLLHYIEPSLQFVLALWVFHEPFDRIKAVSFSFIWFGLILCTIPVIVKMINQGWQKHTTPAD